MACRWQPGMKITALLDALNSALAEPFALAWSQDSPRFLLVFTVIYAVVLIVAVSDQKNTRPGAEHGSAAWGDVLRLNKFYMDRHGSNLLLTQHFHIGIDGYKHKHNTNILIVGGSGAGKTRTYGVPNVLECTCSMVITDPKSEILRKTGNLLEQNGYEVIVFDLINPAASFCYNPFVYVHDDREVLTLIENLIQNTTPSHSKSSDPFWEKSETALLQALMLYLLHEAPPEEQNFSMVMEMIAAAEVHEDDDNYQSPLDILFERLEMREPDSIACKQYRIFKQAAGKTAKSILVSVGVRLAAFNLPSIAKLTMTDELHLQELGERKIALFCCIPDSDKSLNYLVGMIYTSLSRHYTAKQTAYTKDACLCRCIVSWMSMQTCHCQKIHSCRHWQLCVPALFSAPSSCKTWHSSKPCIKTIGNRWSVCVMSFSTSAAPKKKPTSMFRNCWGKKRFPLPATTKARGAAAATASTTSNPGATL